MKLATTLLALSFLIGSTAVAAQSEDGPYVQALSAQANRCTSVAVESSKFAKSHPSRAADSFKKVLACVSSAEEEGIDAYKQYAAGEKDATVRTDMRAVLIAWLVWMPKMVKGVYGLNVGNQDEAGYAMNRAVVTLRVDRAIQ